MREGNVTVGDPMPCSNLCWHHHPAREPHQVHARSVKLVIRINHWRPFPARVFMSKKRRSTWTRSDRHSVRTVSGIDEVGLKDLPRSKRSQADCMQIRPKSPKTVAGIESAWLKKLPQTPCTHNPQTFPSLQSNQNRNYSLTHCQGTQGLSNH